MLRGQINEGANNTTIWTLYSYVFAKAYYTKLQCCELKWKEEVLKSSDTSCANLHILDLKVVWEFWSQERIIFSFRIEHCAAQKNKMENMHRMKYCPGLSPFWTTLDTSNTINVMLGFGR